MMQSISRECIVCTVTIWHEQERLPESSHQNDNLRDLHRSPILRWVKYGYQNQVGFDLRTLCYVLRVDFDSVAGSLGAYRIATWPLRCTLGSWSQSLVSLLRLSIQPLLIIYVHTGRHCYCSKA